MLTQLPGFADPIHEAQHTFRALLMALSRPGIPQSTASCTPPEGLDVGCAAAALTLLDLDTTVWLQPEFPDAVRAWIGFHCGCPFTDEPQAADFAILSNLATAPPLDAFHWGTAEYPEASTSLLLQCDDREGGNAIGLRGPGIIGDVQCDLPLPLSFWQQWQDMTRQFPLGLDSWCFAGTRVVGLPRTAQPILGG